MIEHSINPIIAQIGPFTFYWYGLMYVLSFIFMYFMLAYLSKSRKLKLSKQDIEVFLLAAAAGMIIGARFFEVFVYNPSYYFANPSDILAVWKGGLSFHGGLLGVFIAGWIFCRKKGISVLKMADLVVIPLGVCLAFGRIGNFINGELYGRITNLPWCFKFQDADGCRHPSQIYEAGKNLFIFAVMWAVKDRREKDGFFFSLFLIMYGSLRFMIELVREPTSAMIGPLTMGQLLCSLMIIAGASLMIYIKKKSL